MPVLPDSATNIRFPKMYRVKQNFQDSKIENIESAVRAQLSKPEILKKIQDNKKIAVAVGSRGINNIDKIVKSTVDFMKENGASPFILTAMGSHGGGKPEEQKKILENYGIMEETMGVPISSNIESVQLGTINDDVPVKFDKVALNADMIVPVNRVKPHTDYKGKIESGICKMLVIGLGNHEGCSLIHKEGFDKFNILIPEAAELILDKAPVGFGLSIIENSYDNTSVIEALDSSNLIERESELLLKAKELMPGIHIPDIDILIVNEIGKDITGAGMDPNITGKTARGEVPEFKGPKVQRIVVLGVTPHSNGNAIGIGIADYTVKSILDDIDYEATYANAIASGNPESGKIPITLKNEKEAVAAAIRNCIGVSPENIKIVRIKNTLDLGEIEISEALLADAEQEENLIIDYNAMSF